MQRARGRAAVTLAQRRGRTRLVDLHQSGSAKAFLPRVHETVPEVVFLNTAGGLTGGDALRYSLDLAPGSAVLATTQTAERAYASAGGSADMQVEISAGAGADLAWLPQETILFDRAALQRQTRIALQGDARCLMVETLVLGRAAMGETVTVLDLIDHRSVTRDGVPVLIEPLAISGAALARASAPALLGGARAMATLALVAPGAEDALGRVRAELTEPGVRAAASAWDGKCVLRALASDAYPLRRQLARVIAALGRVPRVWQI